MSKKIQAETWQLMELNTRLRDMKLHEMEGPGSRVTTNIAAAIVEMCCLGEMLARQEAGDKFKKQMEFGL